MRCLLVFNIIILSLTLGCCLGNIIALDLYYHAGPISAVRDYLDRLLPAPTPEWLIRYCETEEGKQVSEALTRTVGSICNQSSRLVHVWMV